jgi:hypothetical protein
VDHDHWAASSIEEQPVISDTNPVRRAFNALMQRYVLWSLGRWVRRQNAEFARGINRPKAH